jgi:hypothetical protein
MIKSLLRYVLFLVGLATLADAGLPTRHEVLTVERHSRSNSNDNVLRLAGGNITSCDVGYSAYQTYKDGNTVSVRATRIFRQCVQVTQGADTIPLRGFWRLFEAIVGLAMIGVAIGKLETEDEGALGLLDVNTQ